jgi:electron transport complex protein RnfG
MRVLLPLADSFENINMEPEGCVRAAYAAKNTAGEIIGYVVEAVPKGYGGPIEMMVAFNTDTHTLNGIRILKHEETPGLGALAAQGSFYAKFYDQALSPLVVVKRPPNTGEIDAITGATITTMAVVNGVNEAMNWYVINIEGTAHD